MESVEETRTECNESNHNTKVSDSAYSNSCSNSQSQRSDSSKSRNSGSHSSGSSGYGGKATQPSETPQQQISKGSKFNDRKKKKIKSLSQLVKVSQDFSTTNSGDNASEANTSNEGTSKNGDSTEPIGTSTLSEATASFDNNDDAQDTLAGSKLMKIDERSTPADAFERNTSTPLPAKPDRAFKSQEGFCCVISMHDGVVLFASQGGTKDPNDHWLGSSFIDFVHPKDRATFANQISSDAVPSCSKQERQVLFVMLRKYRGLKTHGFGIKDKSPTYAPYKLTLSFRESPEETHPEAVDSMKTANSTMLLVVCATLVKSVYKVEDEVFKHRGPKFSTRHTASGIISHIDAKAVPCFGHLPQDLIGHSILDLYHPDDLPLMKEIYETVMKKGHAKGTPFNSKPYRLRVQNGGYITMETDWTSFVNPWTRQLEFVIGHHHVLKGPSDKDVFGPLSEFEAQITASNAETEEIKKDILKMFSKTMTRPLDRAKQQVTKRCKALASFMETLMNEVTCPNLKLDLPAESEITISERESVVLCEISPHHNFYDCKSSTGTPPSYNQLNYFENLQRFFASRPVTATLNDSMREQPGSPDCHDSDDRNCISPLSADNNGDSTGSGSGENYSSGSNMRMESVTSQSLTEMSTYSFKTPRLTKELISRHNDEMEKVMYKKHREARMHRDADKYSRRGPDKAVHDQHNVHGLKRGVSHSWENKEVHKMSKQHYYSEVHNENSSPLPVISNRVPPTTRLMADLWPPFKASIPLQKSSSNTPTTTLYYITSPQPPSSLESPNKLQYIPNGIMAQYPMFGSQHIVYPSPTFMFQTMSYQTMETTHLSPGFSEKPNPSTYKNNTTSDEMSNSNSSFYSSFLKSEQNSSENDESESKPPSNKDMNWNSSPTRRPRTTLTPWGGSAELTADLIYRYEMPMRSTVDVLNDDLIALKKFTQPDELNDQLEQLYLDLENQGVPCALSVSDQSTDEDYANESPLSLTANHVHYGQLSMIYEADAPLPPPSFAVIKATPSQN